MKNRFSREFQPRYINAMTEYRELGKQLKETTREKISEKFAVSVHLISGINRLDLDDIQLIKDLLTDRKKSMNRRAELRAYLHP
jgi:hypothetical protein